MTPISPTLHAAPERHVVLVAPEVHWNTGNIGRTCLGAGATLHLIRPLGFSVDDRQVKRAGLDYWQDVPLHVWDSFDAFQAAMAPEDGQVACFSDQLGPGISSSRADAVLADAAACSPLSGLRLRDPRAARIGSRCLCRDRLSHSDHRKDPVAEPVHRRWHRPV